MIWFFFFIEIIIIKMKKKKKKIKNIFNKKYICYILMINKNYIN